MKLKKNEVEQVEIIEIILSPEKFPIAYAAKKRELVKNGMTEVEADKYIRTTPIAMEVYYEEDYGLFLVESEAVECATIYSPYTKEEMEECSF